VLSTENAPKLIPAKYGLLYLLFWQFPDNLGCRSSQSETKSGAAEKQGAALSHQPSRFYSLSTNLSIHLYKRRHYISSSLSHISRARSLAQQTDSLRSLCIYVCFLFDMSVSHPYDAVLK
jgi:hypothetical protein